MFCRALPGCEMKAALIPRCRAIPRGPSLRQVCRRNPPTRARPRPPGPRNRPPPRLAALADVALLAGRLSASTMTRVCRSAPCPYVVGLPFHRFFAGLMALKWGLRRLPRTAPGAAWLVPVLLVLIPLGLCITGSCCQDHSDAVPGLCCIRMASQQAATVNWSASACSCNCSVDSAPQGRSYR